MGKKAEKKGHKRFFIPRLRWARVLTDFAGVGQSERVKILLSPWGI
jgi:hypothetical protein